MEQIHGFHLEVLIDAYGDNLHYVVYRYLQIRFKIKVTDTISPFTDNFKKLLSIDNFWAEIRWLSRWLNTIDEKLYNKD